MPCLEVVSLLRYAQAELSQDLQKAETELSTTFETAIAHGDIKAPGAAAEQKRTKAEAKGKR